MSYLSLNVLSVALGTEQGILGMDTLNTYDGRLDLKNGKLTLTTPKGEVHIQCVRNNQKPTYIGYLRENVKLQSRQHTLVECMFASAGRRVTGKPTIVTTPAHQPDGSIGVPTISQEKNQDTSHKFTHMSQYLSAGTIIAVAEAVNGVMPLDDQYLPGPATRRT